MDGRQRQALDRWVAGLPADVRERYFLLLDELCRGLDVSKHEQFGLLRLRAEFETSGEIFGCSLQELREAMGERLPAVRERPRAKTPLEALQDQVSSKGHPDLRLVPRSYAHAMGPLRTIPPQASKDTRSRSTRR